MKGIFWMSETLLPFDPISLLIISEFNINVEIIIEYLISHISKLNKVIHKNADYTANLVILEPLKLNLRD